MVMAKSDAIVFFGASGDLAYKKIFRLCRPWHGVAILRCRS